MCLGGQPGHYAHCTYFSLPSTCWTARGYAATGLDLGVFHPSAEGVVESCCSSFSTCLDWIIATTQRESPLFATAMTLRHQKQSEVGGPMDPFSPSPGP